MDGKDFTKALLGAVLIVAIVALVAALPKHSAPSQHSATQAGSSSPPLVCTCVPASSTGK